MMVASLRCDASLGSPIFLSGIPRDAKDAAVYRDALALLLSHLLLVKVFRVEALDVVHRDAPDLEVAERVARRRRVDNGEIASFSDFGKVVLLSGSLATTTVKLSVCAAAPAARSSSGTEYMAGARDL